MESSFGVLLIKIPLRSEEFGAESRGLALQPSQILSSGPLQGKLYFITGSKLIWRIYLYLLVDYFKTHRFYTLKHFFLSWVVYFSLKYYPLESFYEHNLPIEG